MLLSWRQCLRASTNYQFKKVQYSSLKSSVLPYCKLKEAYYTLGLEENAEIEQVKQAYVRLSYKLHPDTGGGANANAKQLEVVREAYKYVIKSMEFVDCNHKPLAEQEYKEFDIKHTAPQHRQFLELGDVGPGTVFERQKQAQQIKFSKAVENTREYSFEKANMSSTIDQSSLVSIQDRRYADRRAKQNSKMTGMIERVVEDMILAAMNAGTFSNLKGAGKPLAQDLSNPYIDETDKRINKVLRNNGFIPLWISREGDIRDGAALMRKELVEEACRYRQRKPEDLKGLQTILREGAHKRVQPINRLIRDYNLITPVLDRQLMQLSVDKEADRAIKQAIEKEKKTTDGDGVKDEQNKNMDTKITYSVFKTVLQLFRQ